MADRELLIKIHEDDYEYIKNEWNIDNVMVQSNVIVSIMNGTPLPKGHGRLIDADALGEELHRYTEAPYLYALKVFNDAPTIIEADKAESEDK